MLFELRSYALRPGHAMTYLDLFRTMGVNRVTRYLPMGGYWLTDSGRLNMIHHLWIYESLDERAVCRADFAQDKIWTQDFVPAAFPLITSQSNAFLTLERGSDALAAAVAGRKTVCPNQSAGDAPFAPGYLSLAGSSGSRPAGQTGEIGLWRVVSGAHPDSWVHLTSEGGIAVPPEPLAGADWTELLRPLSLSPLR